MEEAETEINGYVLLDSFSPLYIDVTVCQVL